MDLKDKIKNITPAELATHGVIIPARTSANGEKTYICPVCGNGTGKTGDGIAFQLEGGAWLAKCFKCGQGFDNFNLLALHYGLDAQNNFREIMQRAAADFGIVADFSDFHNLQPFQPLAQDSKSLEVKKLTAEYIKKLLALPDNLDNLPLDCRRGLSLDTLRHFHCIYNENWLHPKIFAEYKVGLRDKLPQRSRRLIIPTADGNHYNAVLIDSDRTQENKNYWKMHAGDKSTFGIETIKSAYSYTPDKSSATAESSAPCSTSTGFSCSIVTADNHFERVDLPDDLKRFSIKKQEELLSTPPEVISVSLITVDAENSTQKFLSPFSAVSLNLIKSAEQNFQLIFELTDHSTLTYDLPSENLTLSIDKVFRLDTAERNDSVRPNAKIITETVNGNISNYLLPQNVQSISFSKLDGIPDDIPDFLKYTLKIFETTNFELIDDEEDAEEEIEVPATNFVYVFEGEIDCMTAWQNSSDNSDAFIAIGGAAEKFWINQVDERCKILNIKPNFIISFDNDSAGRQNATKVKDVLNQLGYTAVVDFITEVK